MPKCLQYKQGVALKGRNRTGPPCSVGRPNAHVPGPPTAVCPGGWWHYRRRQTTPTDAREHKNTGPLGGPVITSIFYIQPSITSNSILATLQRGKKNKVDFMVSCIFSKLIYAA